MSPTVTRHFDGVIVRGLFAQCGVVSELAAMFADPEVRELFDTLSAANKSLEGDIDPEEKNSALAAADESEAALARILASWNAKLALDDAIALREALIGGRLGQGRADTWGTNRRSA